MRQQHAVGAAVERAQDMLGGGSRRPHDHRQPARATRKDTGVDGGPVEWRMLGVEAQQIETAGRQHFHQNRRRRP